MPESRWQPSSLRDSVLLLGSGISCWHPSNAPTGSEITAEIFAAIFDGLPIESVQTHLAHIIRTPFEVVNHHAPIQPAALNALYCGLLDVPAPNTLHHDIAALLLAGRVRAVVSTNYDTGIEQAAKQIGTSIVATMDYNGTPPCAPILFKVHGSCDEPSTLICRLSQESRLDESKAALLKHMLAGRQLIAIGYSGIDFEICPVIAESSVSRVVWLTRPGDRADSPGLRVIAKRHHIERIEWDLRYGMPWQPLIHPLARASGSEKVRDTILNRLSVHRRRLWALRIACATGNARLAALIIDSDLRCPHAAWQAELGFAHFQAGHYRQAGEAFQAYVLLRATRAARLTRSRFLAGKRVAGHEIGAEFVEAVAYLFHAAAAWRAHGSAYRSLTAGLLARMLAGGLGRCSTRLPGRSAKWDAELMHALVSSRLRLFLPTAAASWMLRWTWRRAQTQGHKTSDVYLQRQAEAELLALGSHEDQIDLFQSVYEPIGYTGQILSKYEMSVRTPTVPEFTLAYDLACDLGNHPAAFRVASGAYRMADPIVALIWRTRAVYHLSACEVNSSTIARMLDDLDAPAR